MDKIDFEKQRADVLARIDKCSICDTRYNSEISERRPVALLCGHPFCFGCIERLRNQDVQNCSICRKSTLAFTKYVPLYNCLQLSNVQKLEDLHQQEVVILEEKVRNLEMVIENEQNESTLQSVQSSEFWFMKETFSYSVIENNQVSACNIPNQNGHIQQFIAIGRSKYDSYPQKHGLQLIDINGFKNFEQQLGPYLEIHSDPITKIMFDEGSCGDVITASIDGTAVIIDQRIRKMATSASANVPLWSLARNPISNDYEFMIGTSSGSLVSYDRRFLKKDVQNWDKSIPIWKYQNYFESGIIEILPYPLDPILSVSYKSAFVVVSKDHGVDIIFLSNSGTNEFRCNLLKNPNLITTHTRNTPEHFSSASFEENTKLLMTATGCPKYENYQPYRLNFTNYFTWELNRIQSHTVTKSNQSLETTYTAKSVSKLLTPIGHGAYKDDLSIREQMDTFHPGCLLRNPYEPDSVLGLLTSYSGDIKLIDSANGQELAHRNESHVFPYDQATITGCFAYSDKIPGMESLVVAQTTRGFKIYDIKYTNDASLCEYYHEENVLIPFNFDKYCDESNIDNFG